MTEPVMAVCSAQLNAYEPAAANVHEPDQGSLLGSLGIGGTGPGDVPEVCVHDAGCVPVKLTLWRLVAAPAYEKSTVPPGAIVTFGAPPSEVLHTFAAGEPTMLGTAGAWLSA